MKRAAKTWETTSLGAVQPIQLQRVFCLQFERVSPQKGQIWTLA